MNKEQFLQILQEKCINYTIEGEKIIVNHGGNVDLSALTTLPSDVHFDNGGYVDLSALTTLPSDVHFDNGGYVNLRALTTLPSDVHFDNGGDVYLRALTTLPSDVHFDNGGDVNLSALTTLPSDVHFDNGGYVDLSALTTLPSDVHFDNGGDVYLSALTTLPENTSFKNKGYVYLRSLETLPENTSFENGGYVDLSALKTLTHNINRNVPMSTNIEFLDSGDIFGYKKVKLDGDSYLVRMKIPAKSKRCHGKGSRKCRAEFAEVLEITKNGEQVAQVLNTAYSHRVNYHVGLIATPDFYEDEKAGECGHGINFFITAYEALIY